MKMAYKKPCPDTGTLTRIEKPVEWGMLLLFDGIHMLAVIKTGGKQYLVSVGTKVKVEKLEGEIGSKLAFETLYVGDEKAATVGTPTVSGAVVEGTILDQDRHDKVVGIKYKPKKRYKMKFGHRQAYTEVEITKVSAK